MSRPVAEGVAALANAFRRGDVDLLAYLDELEARFSRQEPQLQAFVPEADRFGRLEDEAHALLARYPEPSSRPPLFGIPLGVKDIFHVAGFTTHAGSRLPTDLLQGPEAESVRLLKEAGALIVGKTATTEFAYFAPGPTRNPYNPAHTPGGSSSGSAAAVAAGLCLLAFGTQTIGSICRPASYCGVVGFKPSYNRISAAGVIPLSPSLDHVGLFSTGVAAVELAASLLSRDWQMVLTERKPVLAVPEGPYLSHAGPEMIDHFQNVCRRLSEAGYEVKQVPVMADFAEIGDRHNLLVAAEAAEVHAQWFASHASSYHPKTAELIGRGQSADPTLVELARRGREKLRAELTLQMAEQGVDLWLSPPAQGPAPAGLESTGNPVMNLPWTHSGLPALSLPAGSNAAGLPLGLQLAGRWYADETLLEWAIEIEATLQANP
jgi:Asp-tRNA(Asn)/Glu-tRNA(Gln) amidotransferase A subunit family amidase